ncbi:MAG: class I mannose-6-phosphate isomerase [Planctomycetaceae bacterium]|nr:class I mannose-6-phosphate isomerase [Planctomycetaceae bacterium]
MQLLTFQPILKHALWGGRRLHTVLGKGLPAGDDFAESWEVADLPNDITVVSRCSLTGRTLRELMQSHPRELLGSQADRDRFPLLIKFLDAQRRLSVQVHPSKAMAASRPEVTTGKAETWVIIDAVPGSQVYAGLKPGVDRATLLEAIKAHKTEQCLHSYEVQPGDCVSLLPGTVHALGEGILLAEIQEPNNVTYRLCDWGRVDAQGKPRELHLDLALAATNFGFGPVDKVVPQQVAGENGHEILVESEHFHVHRHQGSAEWTLPDDDRMHVLICVQGHTEVQIPGDQCPLRMGETLVVPARRREAMIVGTGDAIVLDAFLGG